MLWLKEKWFYLDLLERSVLHMLLQIYEGLNMPVSTEHVAIYMPLEFVIISVMPLRAFFVLAPKNG